MKKHYSGSLSKGFWKKVNSLNKTGGRNKDLDRLYALGCILQNLEAYTLEELERAGRDVGYEGEEE